MSSIRAGAVSDGMGVLRAPAAWPAHHHAPLLHDGRPVVTVLGVHLQGERPRHPQHPRVDIVRELEDFGIAVQVPRSRSRWRPAARGIPGLKLTPLENAEACRRDCRWRSPISQYREGRLGPHPGSPNCAGAFVADVPALLDRTATPAEVTLGAFPVQPPTRSWNGAEPSFLISSFGGRPTSRSVAFLDRHDFAVGIPETSYLVLPAR